MTIRILNGDVRERLAELPSDSFDCIVTSPPYWGLRDYGTAKWEGGSAECDHAISRGDSAAKSTLVGSKTNCGNALSGFKTSRRRCGARRIDDQIGLEPTLTEYLDTMVAVCCELRRVLKPSGTFWLNVGDSYAGGGGFSPDAPSNLAGAKQTTQGGATSGGIKPNGLLKPKDLCMVPNRLAMRLQEDGWWVRSEIIWAKPNPMPESVTDRPTCSHEKIWLLTKAERYWYDVESVREAASEASLARIAQPNFANQTGGEKDYRNGVNPFRSMRKTLENFAENPGRNLRNVWTIATHPYSEAHFATFPPELAERCIKAGCPAGGHVLDPFGGAGTTGMVADRLGRDATLIELNPSYVSLIKNRIIQDAGMFAQVVAAE